MRRLSRGRAQHRHNQKSSLREAYWTNQYRGGK
jgi:hypothetical protein